VDKPKSFFVSCHVVILSTSMDQLCIKCDTVNQFTSSTQGDYMIEIDMYVF